MIISENLELNIPSMEDAPNAEFIFFNFTKLDLFAGETRKNINSIGENSLSAFTVAETANQKADEALAGAEIANTKAAELVAQMGDIETALDTIIEIQEELIGGDGE